MLIVINMQYIHQLHKLPELFLFRSRKLPFSACSCQLFIIVLSHMPTSHEAGPMIYVDSRVIWHQQTRKVRLKWPSSRTR